MRNALKRAGIGFLLGIALCTVITILTGGASKDLIEKAGGVKAALLLQTALSGLYGALCMGATVIYDAERIPHALSALCHCLCCIVPFFPLSLFLGWADGVAGAFIMAGIQLAVYFVIWLVLYVRYRAEVRELNDIQKKISDPSETNGSRNQSNEKRYETK